MVEWATGEATATGDELNSREAGRTDLMIMLQFVSSRMKIIDG